MKASASRPAVIRAMAVSYTHRDVYKRQLSKSLGEKNFETANQAAVNGVFLAFCSWAIFAVLGVVLQNTQNSYDFITSVVYGITGGIGFLIAIVLFASVRERLDVTMECPKAFEGFPIALITAGLLALAFMGFSGLKVV